MKVWNVIVVGMLMSSLAYASSQNPIQEPEHKTPTLFQKNFELANILLSSDLKILQEKTNLKKWNDFTLLADFLLHKLAYGKGFLAFSNQHTWLYGREGIEKEFEKNTELQKFLEPYKEDEGHTGALWPNLTKNEKLTLVHIIQDLGTAYPNAYILDPLFAGDPNHPGGNVVQKVLRQAQWEEKHREAYEKIDGIDEKRKTLEKEILKTGNDDWIKLIQNEKDLFLLIECLCVNLKDKQVPIAQTFFENPPEWFTKLSIDKKLLLRGDISRFVQHKYKNATAHKYLPVIDQIFKIQPQANMFEDYITQVQEFMSMCSDESFETLERLFGKDFLKCFNFSFMRSTSNEMDLTQQWFESLAYLKKMCPKFWSLWEPHLSEFSFHLLQYNPNSFLNDVEKIASNFKTMDEKRRKNVINRFEDKCIQLLATYYSVCDQKDEIWDSVIKAHKTLYLESGLTLSQWKTRAWNVLLQSLKETPLSNQERLSLVEKIKKCIQEMSQNNLFSKQDKVQDLEELLKSFQALKEKLSQDFLNDTSIKNCICESLFSESFAINNKEDLNTFQKFIEKYSQDLPEGWLDMMKRKSLAVSKTYRDAYKDLYEFMLSEDVNHSAHKNSLQHWATYWIFKTIPFEDTQVFLSQLNPSFIHVFLSVSEENPNINSLNIALILHKSCPLSETKILEDIEDIIASICSRTDSTSEKWRKVLDICHRSLKKGRTSASLQKLYDVLKSHLNTIKYTLSQNPDLAAKWAQVAYSFDGKYEPVWNDKDTKRGIFFEHFLGKDVVENASHIKDETGEVSLGIQALLIRKTKVFRIDFNEIKSNKWDPSMKQWDFSPRQILEFLKSLNEMSAFRKKIVLRWLAEKLNEGEGYIPPAFANQSSLLADIINILYPYGFNIKLSRESSFPGAYLTLLKLIDLETEDPTKRLFENLKDIIIDKNQEDDKFKLKIVVQAKPINGLFLPIEGVDPYICRYLHIGYTEGSYPTTSSLYDSLSIISKHERINPALSEFIMKQILDSELLKDIKYLVRNDSEKKLTALLIWELAKKDTFTLDFALAFSDNREKRFQEQSNFLIQLFALLKRMREDYAESDKIGEIQTITQRIIRELDTKINYFQNVLDTLHGLDEEWVLWQIQSDSEKFGGNKLHLNLLKKITMEPCNLKAFNIQGKFYKMNPDFWRTGGTITYTKDARVITKNEVEEWRRKLQKSKNEEDLELYNLTYLLITKMGGFLEEHNQTFLGRKAQYGLQLLMENSELQPENPKRIPVIMMMPILSNLASCPGGVEQVVNELCNLFISFGNRTPLYQATTSLPETWAIDSAKVEKIASVVMGSSLQHKKEDWEKVKERTKAFIALIMAHRINIIKVTEPWFSKNIKDAKTISQAPHYEIYLRNLFKYVLHILERIKFDPYITCVDNGTLKKSPQEIFDPYFDQYRSDIFKMTREFLDSLQHDKVIQNLNEFIFQQVIGIDLKSEKGCIQNTYQFKNKKTQEIVKVTQEQYEAIVNFDFEDLILNDLKKKGILTQDEISKDWEETSEHHFTDKAAALFLESLGVIKLENKN